MKKVLFTIWAIAIGSVIEAMIIGMWCTTHNPVFILWGVILGVIIILASIWIVKLIL